MRDKETDPEVPVVSHHIEHTVSMEKEKIASDAGIARTWSHDVIKSDEKTKQKNPLAGLTKEELMENVEAFAREKDLEHILDDLKKGALVAQDPKAFESLGELSEEEKDWLRRETTHKWHQPFMMYFMTSESRLLCGTSLPVSDLVQSSSLCWFGNRTGYGPNCSQWCSRVCLSHIFHPVGHVMANYTRFYFTEFRVTDKWLQGLLNGAPYLCSCLIGCWTTAPLNRWFGRRGCIFISCFISFASSFWMAAAKSWVSLLFARFLLGLAVGAKSSTTPVWARRLPCHY